MRHKLLSGLLFAAVFAALASTAMASTTWYTNGVSGSDNNNCRSSTDACLTIGHTISLASSGDSIRVAPATYYYENLNITISLDIVGSGASTTIIDGGLSGTVVTISTGAHVTLSQFTVRNGEASYGGGINNSGTLILNNSTVSGNWAPIPCVRSFVFCELRSGRALGGGIYNSGELIISNSIISGNLAGGSGCVVETPIHFCSAVGGGIYNGGALIISNSITSGNRAGLGCNIGSATYLCLAAGGGIYNGGTLMTIENSTLTANSAATACPTNVNCQVVGAGGAFYNVRGTVTLNNSTVDGNSAYRCSGKCGGMGGAIVNGSGNLAMNNSTVSANSAGGVFNTSTATLQNSIVANNSGENCVGTITSHGHNLSSDGTCHFSDTGDRNNLDPKLGTLGFYGGPTPTIPLLSGSPAIDAGNPNGCTDGAGHLLKTDQRGFPRPDKEDRGGCDIGAYESQTD